MKKLFSILLISVITFSVTSCTTVDTGHEAAVISYGGETDMKETLPEGIHRVLS